MGTLSGRELARLREIESVVSRVELDDAHSRSLTAGVSAMRELAETGAALLYDLEPAEDRMLIRLAHHVGIHPSFTRIMNAFLADKSVGWSGYNPFSPEPEQRNRVLVWAPPNGPGRTPVERHVYPEAGVGGWSTTRVVLCEGAEMLAYVAFFDPGVPHRRAQEVLRRMVPTLARRMRVERDLHGHASSRATIDTLLEEMGTSACLMDERGRLLLANTLAREEYARDPRGFRRRALAATRQPRGTSMRVVRIDVRAGRPIFLIIGRPRVEARAAHVSRSAARLGLTPAQIRVAALVADGHSNRAIALALRIAERTVEAHLTAIFDKAAVGSRAALVALLWAMRE